MQHALAIIFVLIGVAAAAPKQKEVSEKFEAVLTSGGSALLEQLKSQHADQPGAAEQLQHLEKELKAEVSGALNVFAKEFAVTETEAARLLAEGPNGVEAKRTIQANLEKLRKNGTPMPPLPGLMSKRFEEGTASDPWFLETLKRLTNGLVRQSTEPIDEPE